MQAIIQVRTEKLCAEHLHCGGRFHICTVAVLSGQETYNPTSVRGSTPALLAALDPKNGVETLWCKQKNGIILPNPTMAAGSPKT